MRRDQPECTGIAASWCPIHGDCTCPYFGGDRRYNLADVKGCPLHSTHSTHAEPVTVLDDAKRGRWPAAGL